MAFSLVLNVFLLRFTRNATIHDARKDGEAIRWGATSKPTIGGIPLFICFILSALIFFIIQVPEVGLSSEFLGLLISVTLGFLIGLQDDAYDTRPMLKLMGQVTCGVIMIAFGVYIRLFNFAPVDYAITVFWVVGIMNSINLLDNMDGVTGSVSAMILLAVIALILLYPGDLNLNPFLFTFVATTGALLGFLVLNWHPSKLYMGDTGSQFLGALLAFAGIKFLWNITSLDSDVVTSMRIITPIMVFLVPIMDTSFVTFARIGRGQSPFVGGKDHLTHHLTYLGVPERYVPALLAIVSVGSGLVAIYTVKYVFQWNHVYTAIFSAFIVIMMGLFWLMYRRGERMGLLRKRFNNAVPRKFAEHLGKTVSADPEPQEKRS